MKAILALSLLVSGPAFASDAGLLKCLELGDNTARLGCYDSLAHAARAAQAAAPAAAAQAVQQFGRPAPTPEQLDSHIPGALAGWARGGRLRLANGQVWQVNDDAANFDPLDNPKVSIRPGILGSFFMKIEGVGFQIKVKRMQ